VKFSAGGDGERDGGRPARKIWGMVIAAGSGLGGNHDDYQQSTFGRSRCARHCHTSNGAGTV
jgi:hypothetical protein